MTPVTPPNAAMPVDASTPSDAATAIGAALAAAARALHSTSESPRLDAEVLLAHVLRATRSALIVRADETIGGEPLGMFRDLIARRTAGVPVAQLTGTREFWSLELHVTPAVLVPRPETELLVELALTVIPAASACSVLDLGTGSGAIALAIAAERPRALVTGVDVSAAALAVARSNAARLGLPHVQWRPGSWFDAVPGERYDVIVGNPPYIAADDPALSALTAEPSLALTSGPTGVEALAAISNRAPAHLYPDGWLLLEHGSTQAAAVTGMLARVGFTHIESHADLAGRPRVTGGRAPSADHSFIVHSSPQEHL